MCMITTSVKGGAYTVILITVYTVILAYAHSVFTTFAS
jgi:hypothetical protein